MRRMGLLLVGCVLIWMVLGSVAWGEECQPAAPIGIRLNTGQQVELTDGRYITTFTILSVVSQSLAQQKGLTAGDKIFAIEGAFAKAYRGSGYHSTADLITEIQASAGYPIVISYFHPSDPQPRQVTLTVPLSLCGKRERLSTQLGRVQDSLSRMATILGPGSEADYQQREQADINDATAQFMVLFRQLPNCNTPPFKTGEIQGCQETEQIMDALDTERMAIADHHQSLLAANSHMRTALVDETEAMRADIKQLRHDLDLSRGSPAMMKTITDRLKGIPEAQESLSQEVVAWEQKRVVRQRETGTRLNQWQGQFMNARAALTKLQSKVQAYARKKQEEEQLRVRQLAEEHAKERRARQRQREEREQEAREQAKEKFKEFLARHQAEDLTRSLVKRLSVTKNPYAYQNKNIYLDGMYVKNIGPTEAIVAISPAFDSTYIIQMDTARNLAANLDTVRCVMKVLGTVTIKQGLTTREIPHLEEVECLE